VPSPAALAGMLLLAAGCRGRVAHPVFASVTSAPTPARAAEEHLPEPVPPAGRAAAEALFQGWEDVAAPIALLQREPSPPGVVPALRDLADMQRAVERRYRRGGPLGRVRYVAAYGFSGHAPLPPARMAELLMNPAVERHALAADMFAPLGTEVEGPGVSRRRFRIEMLRRGEGPVRFDFRVTTALERWDLPDGVVLLRYDPLPDPPPERITLYRGACVLKPHPSGCEVTEFLVLGTDVGVPFFLEGRLRSLTRDLFQGRVERLWGLAQRRR
jgi:hypothetical protein